MLSYKFVHTFTRTSDTKTHVHKKSNEVSCRSTSLILIVLGITITLQYFMGTTIHFNNLPTLRSQRNTLKQDNNRHLIFERSHSFAIKIGLDESFLRKKILHSLSHI